MKNVMGKILLGLLLAVILVSSVPMRISAAMDEMLPKKNNKFTLSKTVTEYSKYLSASADPGKSITYNIEVPKGSLYINLIDVIEFKVEIINSKNKVVGVVESIREEYSGDGEVSLHFAKGSVPLSKGKYKIRIKPARKESSLYVNGDIAMIKNASRTIKTGRDYDTAITKNKTYKIKFEVKKEDKFYIENWARTYDPNDYEYYHQDFKLVDSKGKTVKSFDESNQGEAIKLKKGIYTITLKASKTGILNTEVYPAVTE